MGRRGGVVREMREEVGGDKREVVRDKRRIRRGEEKEVSRGGVGGENRRGRHSGKREEVGWDKRRGSRG